MTTRKLLKRIRERKANIAKVKLSTALSHLYQDIDIDILFEEIKIIAQTSQYSSCIIRESLEVLSGGKIVYNDALSYNIPGI